MLVCILNQPFKQTKWAFHVYFPSVARLHTRFIDFIRSQTFYLRLLVNCWEYLRTSPLSDAMFTLSQADTSHRSISWYNNSLKERVLVTGADLKTVSLYIITARHTTVGLTPLIINTTLLRYTPCHDVIATQLVLLRFFSNLYSPPFSHSYLFYLVFHPFFLFHSFLFYTLLYAGLQSRTVCHDYVISATWQLKTSLKIHTYTV